jgi:hypothetical protein
MAALSALGSVVQTVAKVGSEPKVNGILQFTYRWWQRP